MKQLVQSVRTGELTLSEVPVPVVSSTSVLVETIRSAVSPGTERSVRMLASASLIGKARSRPDLVRQVVAKARADGVVTTVKAVRNKLDDVMPLGYSGVGTVAEVGMHVDGIRPGMRVATAGAGHGEYQLVAGLLVAPVPDTVSDENAASATIASIALHGIRLANVGPGSRVAVLGLGLLGQITCRLARASGCLVFATDIRKSAVDFAVSSGFSACLEDGADTARQIAEWSRGVGVDAVIVTAGSRSSAPVHRAAEIARDRAEIVIVGAVGMELDRTPLYEKELSLRVARSYGPGRYERTYEDWGVDYPVGYVPWTEGRNLQAVLDLMDTGALDLADLVTHEYQFEQATQAYDQLSQNTNSLGIQLVYRKPRGDIDRSPVVLDRVKGSRKTPRLTHGRPRIAVIGAGNFVRSTMLPALRQADIGDVVAICSASGITARQLAEMNGIEQVHTDAAAMVERDDVDLVVIASPHKSHAGLVVAALKAGKHVLCEKPLGLEDGELAEIEKEHAASGCHLQVGFNRRYSPALEETMRVLAGTGPLVVSYRVNAGELPRSHFYHDRTEGGRLIGEVCHFIDFACALAGDAAVTAFSAAGSGFGEAALEEDLVLNMGFANGTVAAISYGSHGHNSMPKEFIEIMGRGHSVVIDNFETITVDGKKESKHAGKGHVQQLRRFLEGAEAPTGQIGGLVASRLALDASRMLVSRLPAAD